MDEYARGFGECARDTSHRDEATLEPVRDVTGIPPPKAYLVCVGEAVLETASDLDPKYAHARGTASAWYRTLRGVRAFIRHAYELIDEASADLEACNRLMLWHPRSARRHLRRASKAVRKADELRGHAFIGLCNAGTEAQQVPGETVRAVKASIPIVWEGNAMGSRLDALMTRLRFAAADLEEVLPDDGRSRMPQPASRLPRRRFLAHWSLSATSRILALFKRRRRRTPATPADAPRNVSRGRAPPSLEACFL